MGNKSFGELVNIVVRVGGIVYRLYVTHLNSYIYVEQDNIISVFTSSVCVYSVSSSWGIKTKMKLKFGDKKNFDPRDKKIILIKYFLKKYIDSTDNLYVSIQMMAWYC